MTEFGGTSGNGNIFGIAMNGTNYQNLVSFSGTNAADPSGNLTLSGSTLYGMTSGGGTSGSGSIFSVGTNGTNFQSVRLVHPRQRGSEWKSNARRIDAIWNDK